MLRPENRWRDRRSPIVRRPRRDEGRECNDTIGRYGPTAFGISVMTRTVIRLPPEFDVVEEEGQPFAAEERLQCATTVCTQSRRDRRRSETSWYRRISPTP